MTAQPHAQVRFRRAIERRALWLVEDAARTEKGKANGVVSQFEYLGSSLLRQVFVPTPSRP